MTTFITWYDYYLSAVLDCTYYTASNALRMAAQEFCERTKCYRATLGPVTMVANQTIYPIPLPTDAEVFKLVKARMDGFPFDMLLHDQADNNTRRGVMMLDPRQVQVQPAPAAGGKLALDVVLRPSNSAQGVDDGIYAAYAEQIAFGAKARLYAMSHMPFYDPVAAVKNEQDFNDTIGLVSVRVAKAFSGTPLRVQAQFM